MERGRIIEPGRNFFLEEVAEKLQVHPSEFKKEMRAHEKMGNYSLDVMGVRKTWTHWQVWMEKFAPYYKAHRFPKIRTVEKTWDGNTLLNQKGRFFLTDVCKKIPITPHQIRYRVRRCPTPKERYGVWKDDQYQAYLVDMEKFAKWVKQIWTAGNGVTSVNVDRLENNSTKTVLKKNRDTPWQSITLKKSLRDLVTSVDPKKVEWNDESEAHLAKLTKKSLERSKRLLYQIENKIKKLEIKLED